MTKPYKRYSAEFNKEAVRISARHENKHKPATKMEVAVSLVSENRPCVGLACKLVIDEFEGSANVLEAFTHENGVVMFDIPPRPSSGVLKIDAFEYYHLLFANFDPVTTAFRAHNSAWRSSAFLLTATTIKCISKFSKDERVTESGLLDEDTIIALEKRHGV